MLALVLLIVVVVVVVGVLAAAVVFGIAVDVGLLSDSGRRRICTKAEQL